MANVVPESFPMNSGEGPLSYTQNSSLQKRGLNFTRVTLEDAIADSLDIKHWSGSHPFTVADFGCSTGPNTFIVVETIVNAVKLKYGHTHEFQVYFNDHVTNDFNTLFKSIPLDVQYFAAGVAGSFFGRLFPTASLHFVHCSYSLQWLSRVPDELLNRESPAWNGGRITYGNAPKEVFEAFTAQFEEDMSSFLNARAQEIVPGGLMALLLIATPDEVDSSESTFIRLFDMMGSCLMDMAKLGFLNEAEIDAFNLPLYNTSQKEMKRLIEINGCFSVEHADDLSAHVPPDAETCSTHIRAGMEAVFKEHFGSEIMDELYNRFTQKVADSSILSQPDIPPNELFIILKRKLT